MSDMHRNPRVPDSDVDPAFVDRWSPRAFSPDPIPAHQLAALFEAARWAPSCYNEQPWLFLYATTEEDRQAFASALVEKNRAWAARAPLLIFLATRKRFGSNNRPNRHAGFDAGAAWMSLALQARKLGLHAHAMAGFDVDRARTVLKLNEDEYDLMAAIAVGRRVGPDSLPEEYRPQEKPNNRKPAGEIARPIQAGT